MRDVLIMSQVKSLNLPSVKLIMLNYPLKMMNLRIIMLHQFTIIPQLYTLHHQEKILEFCSEILKTMNWLSDQMNYGF